MAQKQVIIPLVHWVHALEWSIHLYRAGVYYLSWTPMAGTIPYVWSPRDVLEVYSSPWWANNPLLPRLLLKLLDLSPQSPAGTCILPPPANTVIIVTLNCPNMLIAHGKTCGNKINEFIIRLLCHFLMHTSTCMCCPSWLCVVIVNKPACVLTRL